MPCAVCIPEWTVDAIFQEEDFPNGQRRYILINAEHSAHWPMISRHPPAPEDADAWSQVIDKAHLLDPRPVLRKGQAADAEPLEPPAPTASTHR